MANGDLMMGRGEEDEWKFKKKCHVATYCKVC